MKCFIYYIEKRYSILKVFFSIYRIRVGNLEVLGLGRLRGQHGSWHFGRLRIFRNQLLDLGLIGHSFT